MKLLFLLIFLFVFPFLILSQVFTTIRGKVVGKQSNSPLSYCPVQIENTSVSVTTNENGDFELHFSPQSNNDTLYISYIGYEMFKQSIQEIITQKKDVFKLVEKPYNLTEIIVGPPLTVKEIIKNINTHFKTNYTSTAFCSKAFFREYLKANEHYDKLMEGAIIYKSNGFNLQKSKWNKNELYIEEVRASLNAGPVKDQNTANNVAFIIEFSEKDILEQLNSSKYNFTIIETEYKNNDKIITLKYTIVDEKLAKQTIGTYKINTTNWAIEEYIYTSEITSEKENQIIQTATDSTKMRFLSSNFIFKFTPLNGKYYFSYAKAWSRRMVYNPTATIDLHLNTEYLTNDIQSGSCTVDVSKKLDKKESLFKQICKQSYHPAFWKNYNLLVDNPELEKVRKELNSKSNIDEQFNNTNKYPTDIKKGKK